DSITINVKQARHVEEHRTVVALFHLAGSANDAMINRLRRRALTGKRPHDAREDVIRRRWEVYEKEPGPALDFYPKDIIRTVDCIGSPARVLQNILEHVVPIREAHDTNPANDDHH